MKKNVDNQFFKEGHQVDLQLSIMQNASLILLALTSVFVLFDMSNDFFSKYIDDPTGLTVVNTFTVLLVVSCVDLGLSVFFPFTLTELMSGGFLKKNLSRKLFVLVLLFICIGQSITTGSLTWISSSDIAGDSIEKPQLDQLTKASSISLEKLQSSKGEFDKDITAQQAIVAATAKDARHWIEEAKKSKGPEMYRLYNAGNDWAKGELRSAIKKAKRKGEKATKKATRKLASLRDQRLQFITQQNTSDNATLANISVIQKEEFNDYQQKKTNRSILLRYLSIIFVFAFLTTTVLRVLFNINTGVDPHLALQNKGFLSILIHKIGSRYEDLLYWIESVHFLFFLKPKTSSTQLNPTHARWSGVGYDDSKRSGFKRQTNQFDELVDQNGKAETSNGEINSPKNLPAKFNQVVIRNYVPVYEHIDKEGNVIYCNEQRVQNEINKYLRKVEESTFLLNKLTSLGRDTRRTKKALKNRTEWLETWRYAFDVIQDKKRKV